jgi:hypothetical protein
MADAPAAPPPPGPRFDEGPRYPGSYVVSYAKHRARGKAQEWAERYSTPGRPPGRAARARAWLLPRLLRVEGLLLAGAAAGGLLLLAARVYMLERLEDLHRRATCRGALLGCGRAPLERGPALSPRRCGHPTHRLLSAQLAARRRAERAAHHEASCTEIAAELAALRHSQAFHARQAARAGARAGERRGAAAAAAARACAAGAAAARWRAWCSACAEGCGGGGGGGGSGGGSNCGWLCAWGLRRSDQELRDARGALAAADASLRHWEVLEAGAAAAVSGVGAVLNAWLGRH